MKLTIIEKSLSSFLRSIGCKIAKHPLYFILFPCVLSIALGTGILRINYNRNMQYLGISQSGRAATSKKIVETIYANSSDMTRLGDYPAGPIIIIVHKNEENLLQEDVFKELDQLDKIVRDVRINSKAGRIGYNELCARKNGECFTNPLIKLIPRYHEIVNKRDRIVYPVDIDLKRVTFQSYAINLGGVTVDENNCVEVVKAFRLFYTVDKHKSKIHQWEESVRAALLQKNFNNITIVPFVYSDLMDNVKDFTESSPYVAGTIAVIVALFSLISCMTDNWVLSKPWLGLSACISASLALTTAFGTMSYIGIDNTDASICICFLVLGTEIDDAYILIAAWRTTAHEDTVEKRLGDTFKEAALSITITSLTNILSLGIGIIAPFPVVKIFCGYAATAMFFAYIYQIAFFGGCMALDGYREKKKLHPFTFQRITGSPEKMAASFEKEKLMTLCKDKVGGMLRHTSVKAVVVIAFVGNLCVGIWGLFHLYDGVEAKVFVPPDSHAYKFVQYQFQYFGQYSETMQIIINETLNYEQPEVQNSIEDMINNFTSHPNIENKYVINWLTYYKLFLNHPVGKLLMHGYNTSEKKDFIDGLRYVFLRLGGANYFAADIIFNENGTEITSTRYFVALKDVYNPETERKVLKDVWKIADESKFPLTLHSVSFPLLEQAIIIRGITTQITWITAVLIMVVFFIFIPQPTVTLLVSLIIVSTIIETVGYMALWDVNLNLGTVTVIILCVGFSVNYPSHVAYSFATSTQKSPDGKLKDCLYHVGLPIFQGSFSTVLSVLPLAFNPVDAYVIFFKIVFLIALFTTFHAMLVLPVFLSVSETLCRRISCIRVTLAESTIKE